MNRRKILRYAAVVVGFIALGCDRVPRVRPVPRERPNVVLIMADDLGYGDVGCYGATKVRTPNIDRLADEGTLFTDAHAPGAVCVPTRYSLLTGRYHWRLSQKWDRNRLLVEEGRTTVAQVYQSAGYATACIGKWHLGFGREGRVDWNKELKPGPLELGFDSYFGTPMSHNEAPQVLVENHAVLGLDPAGPVSITEPGEGAFWGVTTSSPKTRFKEDELATRETAKAVGFIEDNLDKPFFLYFATNSIHAPWMPQKRFRGTSDIGSYGDSIHELDWVVGEIMRTLERHDLADDTLIIFTSDNGAMCHPDVVKAGHAPNGDLIGQKTDAWEGGHRVPFIARWPNHIPAGRKSDELLCLTDILATSAALVGRQLMPDEGPDSCNVLPALLDDPHDQPCRENLVIEGTTAVAIRENEWLLIPHRGSGGFTTETGMPFMSMKELGFSNSDYTRDGELRQDAPPGQLYNMATDPGQSTNLYDAHPEIVERLTSLLHTIEDGVDLTERYRSAADHVRELFQKARGGSGQR
jgi:arylsulfatase A-like enzyme